MLITGEFVNRMIKEHPNMFCGCYFIVEHRYFAFTAIGKFLQYKDGKILLKELYEIKDDEYSLLEYRVIYDIDDLKLLPPTSTRIYSFLGFKNKEAEEENRKDIVKPFEQMNAMLGSLNIMKDSVYGDFGAKES